MAKAPVDIRSLARSHTTMAIGTLARIAQDGESETARVGACVALLDRGWGKPSTVHTLDGEADIRVTIRHIVNGRDPEAIAPKVIEPSPDLDGAA